MQYSSIGIIGGSQGIGKWFLNFFQKIGLRSVFSAADGSGDFQDNVALVNAVDVVVLAVPISVMHKVMAEIYPHATGKLIIDVCSVKTQVVNQFLKLQADERTTTVRYLSIHPMFGPSIKSISGQVFLINHAENISEPEYKYWHQLFFKEKANVETIPYPEHDKMMGIIQGLNHFNLFVSAKTLAHLGGELGVIKKLSSPSYRIFILFYTRYVLQNPRLYAEIQIFNPYVREVVLKFMEEASLLLSTIERQDLPAFEDYIREIQPFFDKNQEDVLNSDILIDHLGSLMSKTV